MKEKIEKENFEIFNVDSTEYKTLLTKKYSQRKPFVPKDPKKIYSFIPGKIKKIYVSIGDIIKPGDKLLILEAMKMKNDIISSVNGKVKAVYVKLEENVANKQLLIEIE